MDKLKEKLEQLQRTVLDLGSELYLTKNELTKVRQENQKIVEVIKALRFLLDDKQIIAADDFDSEISVMKDMVNEPHPVMENEWERLKKVSH